nr:hypothetical protein [uncultured Campylobacter sp.]
MNSTTHPLLVGAKADHGSKNSAAFSPRKILKRRHEIPINFKNGVEFYEISLELKKAAKP